MSFAWAGESFDAKQEQQTQAVRKAYSNIQTQLEKNDKVIEKVTSPLVTVKTQEQTMFSEYKEVKLDGIDHAYVWMRSFTPSWLMGVIFLAGIMVVVPKLLSKFGIEINVGVKQKRKLKGDT